MLIEYFVGQQTVSMHFYAPIIKKSLFFNDGQEEIGLYELLPIVMVWNESRYTTFDILTPKNISGVKKFCEVMNTTKIFHFVNQLQVSSRR